MIRLLILMMALSLGASAQFTKVKGKWDYTDSLRFSKYKNNAARDSVLQTDTLGKIRQVKLATLTTPTLQQVTDAGSITTNGITVQTLRVGLGSGAIATNTAVGRLALDTNTTGAHSTAVGYYGLASNRTSAYNTAIGSLTLANHKAGGFNTAVGFAALLDDTTGYQNTAIGSQTLQYNKSGYKNNAIGDGALYLNITGFLNTALGVFALTNNTVGSYNTALGNQSMWLNISGIENTAVGHSTQELGTSASGNTSVGYYALVHNISGIENVAVGKWAGGGITGSYNTAVGANILGLSGATFGRTLVGYASGANGSGDSVTAIGYLSAAYNTGIRSTFLGFRAGYKGNILNTYRDGIAIGYAASLSADKQLAISDSITQIKAPGMASTSGWVLTDNGSGIYTPQAPAAGGGTVTSVTGTEPVQVATGTTTPVISMKKASATDSGWVSIGTQIFGGTKTLTSPNIITSIVGGSTFSAFNTGSTTINAFGEATTINLGTSVDGVTHNYSAGVTESTRTKTVNIATNGLDNSTTNVNIGSSNGGAINNIKINIDSATDLNWDLLTKNASRNLEAIHNGVTGEVLGANTSDKATWKKVPIIVDGADLTAQTSTIDVVKYTIPAVDGTYRVGAYVTVTAISAGTINLTVTYKDETGATRTQTFAIMGTTTPNITTTGAYTFPDIQIRVKEENDITVTATFTGVSTEFNTGATIEFLR